MNVGNSYIYIYNLVTIVSVKLYSFIYLKIYLGSYLMTSTMQSPGNAMVRKIAHSYCL